MLGVLLTFWYKRNFRSGSAFALGLLDRFSSWESNFTVICPGEFIGIRAEDTYKQEVSYLQLLTKFRSNNMGPIPFMSFSSCDPALTSLSIWSMRVPKFPYICASRRRFHGR